MRKVWILPAVVLLGLLALNVFRWEITDTNIRGTHVYQWKTDRWTSQTWCIVKDPNSVEERPLRPVSNIKKAWQIRNDWSRNWYIAVGVTSFGLVVSLFWPKKNGG